MATRRGVTGMIGGCMAALIAGCGRLFPTTYRFRMTVEVDTPEGVKTGSSVYEVAAANTGEFLPDAAKRTWNLKGDAVAINLPRGHTLFALMKTASRGDLATTSMASFDPAFNNDIVESASRIRQGDGIRSPALISSDDYPTLVTFTDIQDPKTVIKVDPNNLAAIFGTGIRLKSIMVTVVSDPISTGIENQLLWLPKIYSTMLDGSRYNNSRNLANSLTQNDFVSGRKI